MTSEEKIVPSEGTSIFAVLTDLSAVPVLAAGRGGLLFADIV